MIGRFIPRFLMVSAAAVVPLKTAQASGNGEHNKDRKFPDTRQGNEDKARYEKNIQNMTNDLIFGKSGGPPVAPRTRRLYQRGVPSFREGDKPPPPSPSNTPPPPPPPRLPPTTGPAGSWTEHPSPASLPPPPLPPSGPLPAVPAVPGSTSSGSKTTKSGSSKRASPSASSGKKPKRQPPPPPPPSSSSAR
jgi:hypothetical protein